MHALGDDLPLTPAEEVDDEQLLYERHRIVADPGQAPLRIDRFLHARLAAVSRTRVQAGIEAGFIVVNDAPTKASYKIKPGDVVRISLPTPPRTDAMLPEAITVDIVYEDAHLLIVNKPAGMVVHPAHGNWTGTLVNALLHHLDSQLPPGSAPVRPGLVHRIDKDTSGLLVVAKTEEAMVKLAAQFFNHTIERLYTAVVWGVPEPPNGTVRANLGRSAKDRRLVEVKPATEGKHAVTHYRTLERLAELTLIECKLETGRTHQIRVHMKHAGHPLFGDAAYGGDKILKGPNTGAYKAFVESALAICRRQALHARTLGFVHPATGQTVRFEAPLPADMQALIALWRGRGEGI